MVCSFIKWYIYFSIFVFAVCIGEVTGFVFRIGEEPQPQDTCVSKKSRWNFPVEMHSKWLMAFYRQIRALT